MKRVGDLSLRVVVLASLFLLPATGTWAQPTNQLKGRDTTVSAGATGVVIPIDLLSQDQPLTFLSFDVLFDPAVCAALVNPAGIIVRKAGRTTVDPLEQTITCTNGEIRIRLGDIINASVVIPGPSAGTTDFRILELVLGDIQPTASGAFVLTPSPPCLSEGVPCTQRAATIQARNNLTVVTVTGVAGTLTIQATPTTTTLGATTTTTTMTSSTSTSTSSSTTTIRATTTTTSTTRATTTSSSSTTSSSTSTSSSTTTTRVPTTTSTSTTTTTQPVASTTTSTTSTTTTFPSTTTTTIPVGTCPLGQGFWTNHPSAWPVSTLMLGSQTYSEGELLAVLGTPIGRSGSDASLILAHQLIAAKLNIANGSDPTAIAGTVADADRLLAAFWDKLPYGVRPSSALGRAMVGDAGLLEAYNSGRETPTCVGEEDPQELARVASRPHQAHKRSHRRARGFEGQRRTWGPWQRVRGLARTAGETSRPEPAHMRVTESPGSERASRDAARA